jgi:hypothetical protein
MRSKLDLPLPLLPNIANEVPDGISKERSLKIQFC